MEKKNIRPKRGKRVVFRMWGNVTKVLPPEVATPIRSDGYTADFEGVVLRKVDKIHRSSASESKIYYNVQVDSGFVVRVDPFQLLDYAE